MSEERILIVEDDAAQRRIVSGILAAEGYIVTEAGGIAQAIDALSTAPVDLVLSDWKLPDGDGISLLAEVRRRSIEAAFVMVTAYGTIERAVEAIRTGADDYLTKPFERRALLLAIERTLRTRRLVEENRRLAEELEERDRLVDIIGRSPAMQDLFRRVEKLAGRDATVLLIGESGTGKELVARALHQLSPRRSGPFLAVNSAAVPDGLLESEFFGVERGAFTGADRSREGKFELARGGTLFLDEIGELPFTIQPKLLRAIQEARVTRVGGASEIETDVRLIAATNRDLPTEIAAGRFRQDLYYRINVIQLRLPPLRERSGDIQLLVEHFAARAARRHGLRVTAFSPALLKRLFDYPWPGNVRELANVVERLVILSDEGRVSEGDLPDEMAGRPKEDGGFKLPPGGVSWIEHERSCLRQALELAGGNRARAARLLDLPYKAFLYRLEKHGIRASDS